MSKPLGIGHNQGPPLENDKAPAIDQIPGPESDRGTLVKDTNALSGGSDSNHSVECDNYAATSNAQIGARRGVEGFEDRRASAFNRVAGRNVAADGLVSRGGQRRILPESRNREEVENDLEKLAEIAKQVLHGRNGTIFQRHVIDALADGKRRPRVEDTAAQFNIEPPRVYRIIDKCWEKVRDALPRFRDGRRLIGEDRSPVCTICGRHESSDTICPRGHYGGCDWRGPNICIGGKYELHHDLTPGTAEEATQAKSWHDYVTKVLQNWEDTYGPSRLDGPKRKVRESK